MAAARVACVVLAGKGGVLSSPAPKIFRVHLLGTGEQTLCGLGFDALSTRELGRAVRFEHYREWGAQLFAETEVLCFDCWTRAGELHPMHVERAHAGRALGVTLIERDQARAVARELAELVRRDWLPGRVAFPGGQSSLTVDRFVEIDGEIAKWGAK